MADESSISFELARFEWVDPTRLELEGSWNGVSRRLARATLVIEVDGRRRRLRALAEDAGSPEEWKAAFGWNGDDIPRLPGAELEVGRGIVVDLPRPRSSKARAALPKEPIPATTRDDKDAGPGRAEAERILEALSSAQTEVEQARADVARLRAERDDLRDERNDLRAERDDLRTRADEAEVLRAGQDDLVTRAEEADKLRAELDELRAGHDDLAARAEEADALRAERDDLLARADALRAEQDELRARAEEADAIRAEQEDLRARADEAEALRAERDDLLARAEAADALRAEGAGPDVARLRAELDAVERERTELRAQLDSTAQRLEDATQSMPPPTQVDGDAEAAREELRKARRFDRPREAEELRRTRRPAERTAKRSPEPATASLTDKVTDWVGTVMGTRDEDEGSSKNGEAPAATAPAPRTAAAQPATRRRRAAVAPRTAPRQRESPSWALRVAAVGLLALLMIALIVILSSIL